MDPEREVRCMQCKFELRGGPEGPRTIIGYAAVFNQLSENLGGWREMIAPGAFDEVLNDPVRTDTGPGDTRALINHDPNLLLGRTPDTLKLSVDAVGLRYEITPPDTTYARDLLVSIDRGDLDQSSFSFKVLEESWQNPTDAEPIPVRKVLKVQRLYDVSPVTFPAYPTTSVAARSMAEKLGAEGTGASAAVGPGEQERAAGRLALLRAQLRLREVEV